MNNKVQKYKSKRVKESGLFYCCTIILFYCLASAAAAAPTFDAVSTAKCNNCTSVNIAAHAIGGGCTNPILITGASWDNMGATVSLSGVAATGGALTSLNTTTEGTGNYNLTMSSRAGLTGSQSITATFSAMVNNAQIVAVSYCGVDQTTPHGSSAANFGSGTLATVDVASDANELVIDVIYAQTSFTVGAGQTERANTIDDSGYYYGASDETGAPTTTMSWDLALSHYWGIIGIPVRPFVAPPAGTTKRRMIVTMQ